MCGSDWDIMRRYYSPTEHVILSGGRLLAVDERSPGA